MNLKRLSWLIVSLTPPVDFDGAQRSQNYNVDMGADEFVYLRVFLPIILKEPQVKISPTGLQ
jgi:hypothetical protein